MRVKGQGKARLLQLVAEGLQREAHEAREGSAKEEQPLAWLGSGSESRSGSGSGSRSGSRSGSGSGLGLGLEEQPLAEL